MFSDACKKARNYTFPIVISSRNHKDECSAGIGTYVILNDEGWFLTAGHIITQIHGLSQSLKSYQDTINKKDKIQNDSKLSPNQKKQALRKIRTAPNSIKNFSIYMGFNNFNIGTVHLLNEVDLAVGQIVNFDKKLITGYPTLKDPSKPMDQGTSLCKLGFPFHSIQPTFDEGKGFSLPSGSLPIPIFPIEGIYTRTVQVPQPASIKFPLKYIETSTPGLKGQSGGPTFDQHGNLWAIQSQTRHLKLGFGDTSNGGKGDKFLQNQYLNVGWGTHIESVVAFLKEKNIKFDLSKS